MSLTLAQELQYIEDAQRSYVDQGLTIVRASKKGSNRFGGLLTQGLLTANMLRASEAYVPAGTIITPASAGTAVFDLSSLVSASMPNANDIRVTIVRLTTSPTTILDTRINKQGLTNEQWVASIATALNLLAGDYTGTSDSTNLNIAVIDTNTDVGDLQFTIFDYYNNDPTIFYTYFDWETISPGAIVKQYGGAGAGSGKIYLLYTIDPGSGEITLIDDGERSGFTSQRFQTATPGSTCRPQSFAVNSQTLYFINNGDGLVYSYDISLDSGSSHGVAVTPTSTKTDSIHSTVTGFIYFINGGNYQKFNGTTVTNSTSPSIPDDEFLTLNVLNGIPFSYHTGGNTLTVLADSGALTTHVLSINIAGRFASFGTNYYVPQSAARRIYIFNSTFTATSFIDLSILDTTVTSNVKDTYVFSSIMYVIHTDNNVSVFDLSSGAFLDTFYLGVGALSFFSTTDLGTMVLAGAGVYQISLIDGLVFVQPFQNGQPATCWTDADNCLTEAQQIKLMGKVQREWNTSGCNSTSGFTGGGSPIGGSATLIQTSAGQDLLTSNNLYVIE